MKIQELLSDVSRWIKGEMAIDKDGISVVPTNIRAEKWCLVGAMLKCYEIGDGDKINNDIEVKIEMEIDTGITEWNDHPDRTFQDIRNLIEKLNI